MSLRNEFHVAERHKSVYLMLGQFKQLLTSIIENSAELEAAFEHAPRKLTKGRNFLQIFMDDAMDAFTEIMAQPFKDAGYKDVDHIPPEDYEKIPSEFYLKLLRDRHGPLFDKRKAEEKLKAAIDRKLQSPLVTSIGAPVFLNVIIEDLQPEMITQLTSNWGNLCMNFATLLMTEEALSARKSAMSVVESTVDEVNSSLAVRMHNQQATRIPVKSGDGASGKKGKGKDDPDGVKVHRVEDLKDIDTEMARLVGMEKPKGMIREIRARVRHGQMLKQAGLAPSEKSEGIEHYVFDGNPGTGKTTFARLIGKIYKDNGLLKRGHVVEADRGSLVAGYVGQTALKVKEVVKQALGGVLFVDEAYLLKGEGNDFGKEAMGTLLKEMEINKGNLVVVLAGYPKEMEQLVESNPGLTRRFKYYMNFPDFTMDELMQILDMNIAARKLKMTDEARAKVQDLLSQMKTKEGTNFGNAGTVENLVDVMASKLALELEEGGILDEFAQAANDNDDDAQTPDTRLRDRLVTITADIVDKIELKKSAKGVAAKMDLNFGRRDGNPGHNEDHGPVNDDHNNEGRPSAQVQHPRLLP